eukprot:TRINITY_DN28858_c0_g1_i1.p1 TRINITY_DN28858_c0_g1~~TRINITY_DN28858_c0_g1_i1.p1  ORF type:complete len:1275 (-),score=232.81 TRINITY_DN28858_c0_g1_i1:175-3999(-)
MAAGDSSSDSDNSDGRSYPSEGPLPGVQSINAIKPPSTRRPTITRPASAKRKATKSAANDLAQGASSESLSNTSPAGSPRVMARRRTVTRQTRVNLDANAEDITNAAADGEKGLNKQTVGRRMSKFQSGPGATTRGRATIVAVAQVTTAVAGMARRKTTTQLRRKTLELDALQHHSVSGSALEATAMRAMFGSARRKLKDDRDSGVFIKMSFGYVARLIKSKMSVFLLLARLMKGIREAAQARKKALMQAHDKVYNLPPLAFRLVEVVVYGLSNPETETMVKDLLPVINQVLESIDELKLKHKEDEVWLDACNSLEEIVQTLARTTESVDFFIDTLEARIAEIGYEDDLGQVKRLEAANDEVLAMLTEELAAFKANLGSLVNWVGQMFEYLYQEDPKEQKDGSKEKRQRYGKRRASTFTNWSLEQASRYDSNGSSKSRKKYDSGGSTDQASPRGKYNSNDDSPSPIGSLGKRQVSAASVTEEGSLERSESGPQDTESDSDSDFGRDDSKESVGDHKNMLVPLKWRHQRQTINKELPAWTPLPKFRKAMKELHDEKWAELGPYAAMMFGREDSMRSTTPGHTGRPSLLGVSPAPGGAAAAAAGRRSILSPRFSGSSQLTVGPGGPPNMRRRSSGLAPAVPGYLDLRRISVQSSASLQQELGLAGMTLRRTSNGEQPSSQGQRPSMLGARHSVLSARLSIASFRSDQRRPSGRRLSEWRADSAEDSAGPWVKIDELAAELSRAATPMASPAGAANMNVKDAEGGLAEHIEDLAENGITSLDTGPTGPADSNSMDPASPEAWDVLSRVSSGTGVSTAFPQGWTFVRNDSAGSAGSGKLPAGWATIHRQATSASEAAGRDQEAASATLAGAGWLPRQGDGGAPLAQQRGLHEASSAAHADFSPRRLSILEENNEDEVCASETARQLKQGDTKERSTKRPEADEDDLSEEWDGRSSEGLSAEAGGKQSTDHTPPDLDPSTGSVQEGCASPLASPLQSERSEFWGGSSQGEPHADGKPALLTGSRCPSRQQLKDQREEDSKKKGTETAGKKPMPIHLLTSPNSHKSVLLEVAHRTKTPRQRNLHVVADGGWGFATKLLDSKTSASVRARRQGSLLVTEGILPGLLPLGSGSQAPSVASSDARSSPPDIRKGKTFISATESSGFDSESEDTLPPLSPMSFRSRDPGRLLRSVDSSVMKSTMSTLSPFRSVVTVPLPLKAHIKQIDSFQATASVRAAYSDGQRGKKLDVCVWRWDKLDPQSKKDTTLTIPPVPDICDRSLFG